MNLYIKYLLFISLFLHLAAGLYNPLYALLVESLGGSIIDVGVSFSIMPFVIACGLLVSGRFTDHYKNETLLLVIGYLIKTIAFFSFIFVTSVAELIIIQVLFGVSYVISTPAYESFFSKNLVKGKFASNWASWESTTHFAAGVSAIAGGFLLATLGFKQLFMVTALLSFAGLVVSIALNLKVRATN